MIREPFSPGRLRDALSRIGHVLAWVGAVASGSTVLLGIAVTIHLLGYMDGPDFSGLAVAYVLMVVVPVTGAVGLLFVGCVMLLVVRRNRRVRRRPSTGSTERPPRAGVPGRGNGETRRESAGAPSRIVRPATGAATARARIEESPHPPVRAPSRTRPATAQCDVPTPAGPGPLQGFVTRRNRVHVLEMIMDDPIPWLFALAGFIGAEMVWYHVLGLEALGSSQVEIAVVGLPGALGGYAVCWVFRNLRLR